MVPTKRFVPCVPYLDLIKENIHNVDYVDKSFCEGEAGVPRTERFCCNVTLCMHMLLGTSLFSVSDVQLHKHSQTWSESVTPELGGANSGSPHARLLLQHRSPESPI